MKLAAVNPATGVPGFEIECWSESELYGVVTKSASSASTWTNSDLATRTGLVLTLKQILQFRRDKLVHLIVSETGKLAAQANREIDNCIHACDYYAACAHNYLSDEKIASDAQSSYVKYEPVGTVLGIIPCHFPVWHALRFSIPALIAGNTVLLKHASNVPQCALTIEELFREAGAPADIFRVLLIHSSQMTPLFASSRIQCVAFTGSATAGKLVAQRAGWHLKKTIMELGGSDAFIVLEDADIEAAVQTAVASRFYNAGQNCTSAKRIIVVRDIANQFVQRFYDRVKTMQTGDPTKPTSNIGPLAREDLRQKLHHQVRQTIRLGADPITGCYTIKTPGFYYPASILDNVHKGMPAYDEEIFGPVASIIYARDDQDAVRIANDNKYGLGASIWSGNRERAEALGRKIESGMVYINRLPSADPHLPFGGIKHSGFGRQLGRQGILEFANVKVIAVNR